MRKNNCMVGMFIGLVISLVLVPMIVLVDFNRDASFVDSKNAVTEANINSSYIYRISNYSKEASEEGRTETAQDILRDYKKYLDMQ